MVGDEPKSLAPLLLHEWDFPEPHIFVQCGLTYRRMNRIIGLALRKTVIANPNFEPEIVAKRDEPVESAVVAHLPGQQQDHEPKRTRAVAVSRVRRFRH